MDEITIKQKELDEYTNANKPISKEFLYCIDIVKQFVIDKKRILYGGSAISLWMQEYKYPDINKTITDFDFYSNDPKRDAIEIYNLIHSAFTESDCKAFEAKHSNTFKVVAFGNEIADITYAPTHFMNVTPFKIINKIHVLDLKIIMIDLYRIILDPLESWKFKLDKAVYRLNFCKEILCRMHDLPTPLALSNKESRPTYNFVTTDKILIVDGAFVETYYAAEAAAVIAVKTEFPKSHTEILCTNPYICATEFIKENKLKDYVINTYTPFFQFYNTRVEIKVNNKVLIVFELYPETIQFPSIVLPSGMHIATFDHYIKRLLIKEYKKLLNKDKSNYLYIFQLLSLQKEYNTKLNKSGFESDSPFGTLKYKNLIGDTTTRNQYEQIRYFENGVKKWRHDKNSKVPDDYVFRYPNFSGNLRYVDGVYISDITS